MEEKIIEQYQQGHNGNQISKLLDLPMATVYRKLRKNRLEPKKRQWGRNQQFVIDVIEAYKAGESGPSIANRIGCNPSTITRILARANVEARPYSAYEIDENFFSTIDTEAKAYALGFFTADGCLTKGGVMVVRVTDRDVIEKIKAAMGHTSPIRVVEPTNPSHKSLYALEVGRKQLAEDLIRLGCGPAKTFTTSFPQAVPDELHRHFIRGLFDGDGSLTKRREQITSFRIAGTAALLGTILGIIREATGVGGGLYPEGKIFILHVSGNRQMYRVLDWLYHDATIYMDRKHKLYLEFINGI